MASQQKAKRALFFENLAHYLTAFVILLKGFDKITTPGKTVIAAIFILIGVIIFLGTALHHRAQKLLKNFKAYVLASEAIVLSLIGYLYVEDGKQMIQYAFFIAAICFLIAFIVHIRKARNTPNEIHPA